MEPVVTPRLIVVRGPSGSGKTTVARRLFERAVRRVCLIEQDHYRFIFRPAGGGSLPNSATIHRMIEHNVMAALADGFDVILEGILSVRSYGPVLDRLFSAGVSEHFLYSFDLSLDETLRRHRTRLSTHDRLWLHRRRHAGLVSPRPPVEARTRATDPRVRVARRHRHSDHARHVLTAPTGPPDDGRASGDGLGGVDEVSDEGVDRDGTGRVDPDDGPSAGDRPAGRPVP